MFDYGVHVTWAQAVVWALTGVAVAEAALWYNRIRSHVGHILLVRPNRQDLIAEALAVTSRVIAGAGLAAAGAAGGQICEAGAAFLSGLAAPVLVAKLFQIVGASMSVPATPPTQASQFLDGSQQDLSAVIVPSSEDATTPRKAPDVSR